MRILTVRQPWAWAIIHGGKNVENRVRNIAGNYRGPVAIHAALQPDQEAYDLRVFPHVRPDIKEAYKAWYQLTHDGQWLEPAYDHVATRDYTTDIIFGRGVFTKGAILGVVDMVDVHRGPNSGGKPPTCGRERKMACSVWGQRDAQHLVLENPRALATPIPHKGALGLRHVDAELEARIWAEVS